MRFSYRTAVLCITNALICAASLASEHSAFYTRQLSCVGSGTADSVWCRDSVFQWRPPRALPIRSPDIGACAQQEFADQRLWKSQYGDLREAPVVWSKYLEPLTRELSEPLYYLEVGGYDGVAESNTLVLARCAGWRGVLIEGVRKSFQELLQTRPTAHLVHQAPNCDTHGIVFIDHGGSTGASLVADASKYGEPVHCGPLGELVAALGVPRLDFWSLDVEDHEQSVLETYDFTAIPVRYILIEVENRFRNETKKRWLRNTFAPRHNLRFLEAIGASWLFAGPLDQ